jgi:pimeloyl-ACP methyl ester carboxylesterase
MESSSVHPGDAGSAFALGPDSRNTQRMEADAPKDLLWPFGSASVDGRLAGKRRSSPPRLRRRKGDRRGAAVQQSKQAEAQLRPISAPTVVIWGQRDRYLGPKLAEPDRDDVPNLDRVERLPEASHWVHHDDPERVTQLLVDFFASTRPTQDRQASTT